MDEIPGYKLVFEDEFNYDGAPDPQKWNFDIGFIRNHEPQWYQKENAVVRNGNLIITAKKEDHQNDFYNPKSEDWRFNKKEAHYTSSALITRGKFEFRYGRVEIRAKIDIAKGQWPAFWMLGANRAEVSWPACGEVDIMEYYRDFVHANLAWQGKDGGSSWSAKQTKISDIGNAGFWKQFHVWRMDWDPDLIRIYLDGRLLNETSISNIQNGILGNNPFHEKFFMVLNLALGQGGESIPDDTLPSEFVVDYVRVYQKD